MISSSYTVKNLKENTKYYVKMVFKTPNGWISSDAATFTTGVATEELTVNETSVYEELVATTDEINDNSVVTTVIEITDE